MKRLNGLMSVVVAAVLGFACFAQADAKDDARERRKERHAQIVELVQAGRAQEGSDGYLVAQAGLSAQQAALVQAENADRKIGYEAIAKANGKTVEEIGRQAAAINKARAAKK
jgi:uncharacterized protein YdbL (DUF1318 family)